MMDNATIDRDTMIRVNVPGTSGFFRLRCEAFFTVSKSDFNKMMKALKADTETAEENARILFDFARYMEKECNKYFFRENAERIAEINSVWNAGAECFQLSKAEKAAGKAFQECTAGKKCHVPLLKMPFEYNRIIYASDSFIAARYDGDKNRIPVMYTPEDAERTAKYNDYVSSRPNMEKLFPADLDAVKAEYSSVRIPDLPTLKAWKKTAKNADPAVFKAEDGSVFAADYLYKAAALTLSNTLYFSDFGKPAVMTGNGYTVIICGMLVSPQKCNTLFQAVKNTPAPALVKVSFDTFGETVTETMPCVYESTKPAKNDLLGNTEAAEAKENNISSVPAGKEHANNAADAAIISDASDASAAFQEEKTESSVPDPEKLYKIAGVELEKNRIEEVINNNDYLVKSRTVYRIERTRRGYIAINVYQKKTGVPIIGGACRFTVMNRDRLERMFPDFADKEFKPVPAADPEKPETMPETMPESMPAVIPTKTAENGAETVNRYDIHIDTKHAENGAEMPLKSKAARMYYSGPAETGISAGIEKMSICTKSTVYTIITNYHNMPTLPVMHEMYKNNNMHNPHKLHNSVVAGFPSAPFCAPSAAFCDGKNAFCDIPSGVPPGPPGMRV